MRQSRLTLQHRPPSHSLLLQDWRQIHGHRSKRVLKSQPYLVALEIPKVEHTGNIAYQLPWAGDGPAQFRDVTTLLFAYLRRLIHSFWSLQNEIDRHEHEDRLGHAVLAIGPEPGGTDGGHCRLIEREMAR